MRRPVHPGGEGERAEMARVRCTGYERGGQCWEPAVGNFTDDSPACARHIAEERRALAARDAACLAAAERAVIEATVNRSRARACLLANPGVLEAATSFRLADLACDEAVAALLAERERAKGGG